MISCLKVVEKNYIALKKKLNVRKNNKDKKPREFCDLGLLNIQTIFYYMLLVKLKNVFLVTSPDITNGLRGIKLK